jgi:hypothetical protein
MRNTKMSEFQKTVFVVRDNEVEEITFGSLVREFADETTSPNGVAPRFFYDGNEEEGYDANTWGVGGNNRRDLDIHFDTEEEAEEWLLNTFEHDMDNSSESVYFFDTEEEAEALIISRNAENLESEKDLSSEEAEKKAREEFYEGKKEREEKQKADAEARRIYDLPANVEARRIAHEEAVKRTQDEFPKLKEKFLAYFESKKMTLPLSNKEANAVAWKKQNWITGGADVVTLRSELKSWTRNISEKKYYETEVKL